MPFDAGNSFEVSVIQFPRDVPRWHLVHDFWRLRKQVFVDQMGWNLVHADSIEFEQYDTLASVFVIAHRGDRVLGGARLLRTDWEFGTGKLRYSYMIRDAHLGHLPGLPSDVCADEPPVSDKVWELTRLASIGGALVGAAILNGTNDWLRSQGAKACLFLGPPSFMRMAKSMGYDPQPMGKITGNGDGRFLAFSCPVIPRSSATRQERSPASTASASSPSAT